MSINIYKQSKIAVKADKGRKNSTPWKWRGPHFGLALILVIKNEGEIVSDRLMELHHALGQWAAPKRHKNGRTRGKLMISIALGSVQIQHCKALIWLNSTTEIGVFAHNMTTKKKSCIRLWKAHFFSQNNSLSAAKHQMTSIICFSVCFTSRTLGAYFWFTCTIIYLNVRQINPLWT